MSTPQRHLETLFILDDAGRILSTREPGPSQGPIFSLIRGPAGCAWAVRADLPQTLADELERLAQTEPPIVDLRAAPVHADRYLSLVGRHIASDRSVEVEPCLFAGPSFTFPDVMPLLDDGRSAELPDDIILIEDERLLAHNFSGWIPGEIAAGRAPLLALIEDGHPVSVCFCARSSDVAAEAGLETAAAYRGCGYGPRVTAAWAEAIRASGRLPFYSTSWDNAASLAVARKLGLVAYASSWSLSD